MALLGQASGGWTESSSALRLLNVGIRNSNATATDDAFTQANPVALGTSISTKLDITKVGVLSGSVCFSRCESAQQNMVGGPGTAAQQIVWAGEILTEFGYRPLGIFINSAAGNSYENLPAVASGVTPYVCGMGTYGSSLYETHVIAGAQVGTALVYTPGVPLISSRNGLLMPRRTLTGGGAIYDADIQAITAESFVRGTDGDSTTIGVIRMAPDAVQSEVVWDQRL